MCTSPVILRNKFAFSRVIPNAVSEFDNIHMPARNYLRVPCGHCPECQQAKKDAFFIRCRDEFIASNRRAVFLTLTYKTSCLPSTSFVSAPVYDDAGNLVKDGYSFDYSHWSRKHISNYFKRINEKIIFRIGKSKGLTRLSHGSITPEWLDFVRELGRPIKYLCVCERGKADIYTDEKGRTRFGTARPHYHAIIFLSTDLISVDDVMSMCVDNWKYGISYPLRVKNDKGDDLRDEMQCIDYVTKYVCKDNEMTYKNVSLKSPDILFSSDKERRNAMPFVSCSNFLGFSQFASLSPDYVINTLVPNGYKINGTSGRGRSVNIPTYYLNKFNYVNTTKRDVASYPQISDSPLWFTCWNAPSGKFFCSPVPSYFLAKVRYKRHCRYHSKREVQWDTTSYPPSFICEYKRALPVSKSYNMPTQYGQQLRNVALDNKVEFISTLFAEIKKFPQLINYYYAKRYSKIPSVGDVTTFSHLIAQTCLHDFQDFVYHHLDNDINNPLQLLYNYLITLQATKVIGKRIEREYRYKANLDLAIYNKPALFNVCPINSENL